eukprot:3218029-Prymnesium_polylepis.1
MRQSLRGRARLVDQLVGRGVLARLLGRLAVHGQLELAHLRWAIRQSGGHRAIRRPSCGHH